jgi:hypothetical protein
MTYPTEAEMRAETPAEEQSHFTLCDECGQWFDMRQFDDMVFHCFGHVERPDFNVAPGIRVD